MQRRERLYEPEKLRLTSIPYTEEQLRLAYEQQDQLANYYAGGRNGTTFYAQNANLIGALGQNVLNDYLVERGINIKPQAFFVEGQKGDIGDFIFQTRFGRIIADIKATTSDGEPHGGFWCKVKETTTRPSGQVYDFTKKRVHHYIFTSVDLTNWMVHVMGVIRFVDFWDENTPHSTFNTTLDDGTIIKQRRVRAKQLKPLWDYLTYYK